MKNNGLLIVGVAFVALLIGWFATRETQPKAGVKELKVAAIKADDVTRIEMTVPPKEAPKKGDDGPADDKAAAAATTVVLERDGASFVVSSAGGKKHAVDEAQLKPLLDAIGEFKAGDVVANKADKQAEFEIDDAKGTHVVISTAKGKALDLLFGRAAKGGGTTVRQQGSSDIFVAKGRLGSLVKKDEASWRKKSILDKKIEDIAAVTVVHADGSKLAIVSETKEEAAPPPAEGDTAPPPAPKKTTTWKLTEPSSLPSGFRLDDAALARIPQSLAALRATDFADDATDAVTGFGAAHDVVTAKLNDGKELAVHFGNKDDKKRFYVRVDGDPQVYLLAEYAVKNVDRALDDLRDLSVFTAKIDDVTRATFTAGKTKFVVKKDGAAWSLVEPKTAPPEFDAAQVGNAVTAALRLKAARLGTGVADVGGADPSIELTLANGKTEAVRFGKALVEEGAKPTDPPKEFYVKGADGQVYVVASYAKSRYEKPNELFKKPPAPPASMGGAGGMQGLDSLPPDIRKKLEASMKKQGLKQ